jgi:signal transduction histidine kinase
MTKKKQSLSTQIKKEIGNRILFCSSAFILIIFGLTAYDLSVSVDQLRARINEQVKPLEDFTIGQVLIDNARTIDLKVSSFNDSHPTIKVEWISVGNPKINTIVWHPPFSWGYDYKLGNIAGYSFGYFKVTGSFLSDKTLIYDLIIRLILLLIFSSAIQIVLNPLAKRIPEKLFINPINRFIDLVSNSNNNNLFSQKLPTELEVLETKILDLLSNAKEHERNKTIIELGHLATQVAHDIRSPLAVLNIETKSLSLIPEKNRINIANAIQRVNDIANNLLSKYKKDKNIDTAKNAPTSELVSMMLENIVSEKRVQIINKDIQIILKIHLDAYNVFINVDIAGFKRVLSNIINNAIEAIDKQGTITVELITSPEKIFIRISDNGCGIPKDKLPLVFDEGVSFGKKNGSGLGLPYVINMISSWQGDYFLTSESGEGTVFEIIMPIAKPAEWFAQEINIMENDTIIILDDDDYIHQIWEKRFSDDFNKSYNLKLHHFYEPKEFIEFCQHLNLAHTRFLIDYELIGHQKNGLKLVEILSIGAQSILVTSRYEDSDIRKTCQKLGMKIIPKPFAERTPINVASRNDIVFIDDEEIMTTLWEESAKRAGIAINIFNDPREFMRVFQLYKKNTLIYIDSCLGGSLKGEDFAKILFEEGFQNIILTTGFPKENFKEINWIKDIIGKEPPWN